MLDIIDNVEKKDIVKPSKGYSDYDDGPITYKNAHLCTNLCTLPTVIISKIYEMAVWEEGWYADVSGCVIRVSSINRRCRDIAVRTPLIWVTISGRMRPEILDIFIKHSMPHKLTVVVNGLGNKRVLFLHIMDCLHCILDKFPHSLLDFNLFDRRFIQWQTCFIIPELSKLTIGISG